MIRMIKIKKKQAFTILVSLILLVTVIFGIEAARFTVIYAPLPFHKAAYDNLVSWVNEHDPPYTSMLKLPNNMQSLSKDGNVYITGRYIFIPCWKGQKTLLPNNSFISGEPDDLEGYLYSRKPIEYDKNAGDIPQVTINIPTNHASIMKSTMFIPNGSLAKNWFYACSPDTVPI